MEVFQVVVNGDEGKIREAFALLTELGFSTYNENSLDAWIRNEAHYLIAGYSSLKIEWNTAEDKIEDCKELTLPQLRDLVAQSKKDQGLISGADALADITNVQHAYNCSDDWYTTQYSTLTIPEILKSKTTCGHEIIFRLKPTTITVNTELPKPEREFHQNTEVFAVTYEFKSREERNAFARKLRGNNS